MATKEFVVNGGSDKKLWDDDFDGQTDEDWAEFVRQNSNVDLIIKIPKKTTRAKKKRFEPRS